MLFTKKKLTQLLLPGRSMRWESAEYSSRHKTMGLARACGLALIFLAMSLPALAESLPELLAKPTPVQVKAGVSDGVSGLIINGTLTPNGQEFFRSFTEFWREKPDGDHYSLDIVERPSLRFGNQVMIMYGQKRVYMGALPIKFDKVRGLSEQAVETTYANIISVGLFAPSSRDPDLSADEL